MFARIVTPVLALALAHPAFAQGKKKIDKAADLPRFTYAIDGRVEDLICDAAKFKPFADALKGSEQIKALQEKPADKLLSGMQLRAIVAAAQAKM